MQCWCRRFFSEERPLLHPHRSKHDRHIAEYPREGVPKVIGIVREVEGRRKDGTIFSN